MKDNQKGITLVEVIVVVAILGIMSSLVTMSFNVVFRQKASGCAESIDSFLERVRLDTMSKADKRYLVLYRAADGIYMAATTEPSSFVENTKRDEKVCDNSVVVQFMLEETTTYVNVDTSRKLILTFDRSTGGFEKEYIASKYITQIRVSSGGNSKVIQLIKDTGKHYIE